MYYRVDLQRHEWVKLRDILKSVQDNFKGDEDFDKILSLIRNKKKISSTSRKKFAIEKARSKKTASTKEKIFKAVKKIQSRGEEINYSLLARESGCSRNSVKKYYCKK